jgi:N-methylhydantoinase B
VRLGFVSREAARETYGVVLDDKGDVDPTETRNLREGAAA